MQIDMKKIIHDTTILFVICIISGLLLGLAHEVTYPITTARKAAEKAETYASMITNADHFEDKADMIESTVATLASAGINASITDMMYAVDASGNPVGYAFSVKTAGKIAEIVTAVCVDTNGTVLGIDVLESSETSGLGSKADEPAFKDQFAGQTAKKLSVVKGAAADGQIEAIGGATVTSRAVTDAANAALAIAATLK